MAMKLIVCMLALLAAGPSDQAARAAPDSQATRPADAKAQEIADAATTNQAPETTAPTTESTTDNPGGPTDPAAQPQRKATPATKVADAVKQTSENQQDELLPIEANIVSYTNRERERYGLPPLKVDRRLMLSARRHCAWMARNQSLVHTSQPVAENIAMGQNHSSEAVRDWMNSSGHRANILNRSHMRIGVAAYRTRSGRIFWCQQFGR